MEQPMKKQKWIICRVLVFWLLAIPALADFGAGWRAYEKGDYATALREWLPLAQRGDVDARFLLAFMYEKGRGVPQDYPEALTWYRMAAEQGLAMAQVNLGLMYSEGRGVAKDYQDAVKWFRMAAEQGSSKGQGNLGEMYAYGQGVPQDYVRAYVWFSLSSGGWDDVSAHNRDVVAQRITPAQIAEAQDMVNAWIQGRAFSRRREALAKMDPRFRALSQSAQLNLLSRLDKREKPSKQRWLNNLIVWDQADQKGCDFFYQDGEQIFISYSGPLTLATSIHEEKDFVVAWICALLDKNSKVRIDILPDQITLCTILPQVALKDPANPDRLSASMVRKARIWGALLAGLSGMATSSRTTYESGEFDGAYTSYGTYGRFRGTYSGTSTTTQPDYSAREQGQRAAQRTIERAEQRAQQLSMGALRGTTLVPGAEVSGLVYFPKDKRGQSGVLRILIGTTDFEFPFLLVK
jgi:TPR repeat protein